MLQSGKNRSKILQILDNHSPHFGIDYRKTSTVKDYFVQPNLELLSQFKLSLEQLRGVCVVCNSMPSAFAAIQSLVNNQAIYCTCSWVQELLREHSISYFDTESSDNTVEFSITSCEALSARTGSVVVTSSQIVGRRAIAYAEKHIVLAFEEQLVDDLDLVFAKLAEVYGVDYPSQITCITGPSRTADIEKTLVLGAHGPKELYVFIVKQEK